MTSLPVDLMNLVKHHNSNQARAILTLVYRGERSNHLEIIKMLQNFEENTCGTRRLAASGETLIKIKPI